MDQLLAENVALQAENNSLQKQLERSKRGLFIGANVGLPLGGDAIIMYQFNKSGVYSQVGYQDGFNINRVQLFLVDLNQAAFSNSLVVI
jgi:regulator of replication initiation timing